MAQGRIPDTWHGGLGRLYVVPTTMSRADPFVPFEGLTLVGVAAVPHRAIRNLRRATFERTLERSVARAVTT
jgi:hypothetical protein